MTKTATFILKREAGSLDSQSSFWSFYLPPPRASKFDSATDRSVCSRGEDKTTNTKARTWGICMSTPQRGFRVSRSLFCCHLRSDIFHSTDSIFIEYVKRMTVALVIIQFMIIQSGIKI